MSGGNGRSRARRVVVEPDREPDALPVAPRRELRMLDRVLARGRSPRGRRTLLTLLIGIAALLVIAPLLLWVHYRMSYVLSRNAQVKGYITNVGAQLDGVVTSVEVEPGQRVRAGQILARFEDHQLQANVQRALSRYRRVSRALEVGGLAVDQEGRRLGGRVTEASARTDAARAQVDAAQSQADDAGQKYALRKTLADGGLIAQEELRNAETARRTAEALAATARADQTAAEAAQRLAEVESDGIAVQRRNLVVLQAEVAEAKAELEIAEADLRAALIRAPADGWVVRRIAEAGASVVVGQPVVALWIGANVWVEAWIDEDDLAKVAAGNPARVTVKAFPQRVYTGTVEMVGVSTDYELPDAAVPQPRNTRIRATPVVCVRVRLAETDGLFPGLSAVVGIRKKAS